MKGIVEHITNTLKPLDVPEDTYSFYLDYKDNFDTMRSTNILGAFTSKLTQIAYPMPFNLLRQLFNPMSQ